MKHLILILLSFVVLNVNAQEITVSMDEKYDFIKLKERNWLYDVTDKYGFYAPEHHGNARSDVPYEFAVSEGNEWKIMSHLFTKERNYQIYGFRFEFKGEMGIFYTLIRDYDHNRYDPNNRDKFLIVITRDSGKTWKEVENDIKPTIRIAEYTFEKSDLPEPFNK